MENYISLYVAVLEQLNLLTTGEAQRLSKKLRSTTIPGTYDEASRVIRKIFEEEKINVKKERK